MSGIEAIGLDHVLLTMPTGGEREARRFYGEVLGLREVPKPDELGERGGCWFVGPGIAIHLGVDQRFIAARKGHPAIVVTDIERARETLRSAGARVHEDPSSMPVRRCYVEDPFGNRIELVDARDAGFTDPAARPWTGVADRG